MTDSHLIPDETFNKFDRTIKELASREPPERLYHYTTNSGFLGIVQSKELWASDLRFLNDSREIRHGLELIGAAFDRGMQSLADSRKARLVSEVESLLEGFNEVAAFAVSLAVDGDQLGQWRAYGGRGGYALGLWSYSLKTIEKRTQCILAPVIYDKAEQQRFAEMFAAEVEEAFFRADTPGSHSIGVDVDVYMLRFSIIQMAALMKDRSFREECEWRLLAPTLYAHQIRLRPSSWGIVPYIGIPLGDDSLDSAEVIVGPCPHPELAKNAIALGLGIQLFDNARDPIRSSTIPYRNW